MRAKWARTHAPHCAQQVHFLFLLMSPSQTSALAFAFVRSKLQLIALLIKGNQSALNACRWRWNWRNPKKIIKLKLKTACTTHEESGDEDDKIRWKKTTRKNYTSRSLQIDTRRILFSKDVKKCIFIGFDCSCTRSLCWLCVKCMHRYAHHLISTAALYWLQKCTKFVENDVDDDDVGNIKSNGKWKVNAKDTQNYIYAFREEKRKKWKFIHCKHECWVSLRVFVMR